MRGGALTLGRGSLARIPDYTAHRMMMVRGSGLLLDALCPPPEPAPVAKLRPSIIVQDDKPDRRPRERYVRMDVRETIRTPEAVREIIADVAEAFNISAEQMLGNSRKRIGVLARAVAIRLVRDRTWETGASKHSTTRIGHYFNRDHATICHALDHFEDYCKHYPEIVPVYEGLRA